MAGNALVDYATEHLVSVTIEGASLHSVIYCPFGQLDDPMSWFKSKDFGDIKLKLTGQASAGAVKVLTQQLRI